jgi:hypothetical protein
MLGNEGIWVRVEERIAQLDLPSPPRLTICFFIKVHLMTFIQNQVPLSRFQTAQCSD